VPTLLVLSDLRATLAVRADVGARAFSTRVGLAAAAAAASTVLVVGYPVLVRVTSTDAVYDTAAPLLLAVMLTRAPLMLPLSAYQGVAITHFSEHRARGLTAARPIFVRLLLAGAVFSVAWALVGPPALRVLGSAYDVSAGVFVLLAAGATCVALVTLSGAMCLAHDRHRSFTAGWLLALVGAVAMLFAPWSLTVRVVASLFAGPLAGASLHLAAVSRPFPHDPSGAVPGRSAT
jgi:O-antigen/teichoic acid export membrane protein